MKVIEGQAILYSMLAHLHTLKVTGQRSLDLSYQSSEKTVFQHFQQSGPRDWLSSLPLKPELEHSPAACLTAPASLNLLQSLSCGIKVKEDCNVLPAWSNTFDDLDPLSFPESRVLISVNRAREGATDICTATPVSVQSTVKPERKIIGAY